MLFNNDALKGFNMTISLDQREAGFGRIYGIEAVFFNGLEKKRFESVSSLVRKDVSLGGSRSFSENMKE